MNLKKYLLSLPDTFEDNEYLDKYVSLIEDNLYTEKVLYSTQMHHIVPKCWYSLNSLPVDNSQKNKVNLLYKDHIIAHCYIVLSSKENKFKYMNRIALDKLLHARFHLEEVEDNKNMDIVQLAYESSRKIMYKNNPMFIESSRKKHDDLCKTESFRNNVSVGRKKYIEEFGFSDEHRKKLSIASKRTFDKKYKDKGLSPFGVPYSTRSIGCYCVLSNGEKHIFDSYKDGGIWWFENFHPFGDKYVQPTFQRKIIDMCDGKDVYFHNKKMNLDYIKWYRLDEKSCAETIESV